MASGGTNAGVVRTSTLYRSLERRIDYFCRVDAPVADVPYAQFRCLKGLCCHLLSSPCSTATPGRGSARRNSYAQRPPAQNFPSRPKLKSTQWTTAPRGPSGVSALPTRSRLIATRPPPSARLCRRRASARSSRDVDERLFPRRRRILNKSRSFWGRIATPSMRRQDGDDRPRPAC